ncbi:MATE family efflux transporter [Sphingomonas sp.]|uniref:MATE family efflux transporter n=1 Tax=Sphingomonas sp. TaxID=28214 RepID=UPI001B148446|nr:MATE family efflux transporter [Sphingomonas sp.]MBO9713761.1 MATE family efflux transporter [Sphingomonas sp.]
MASQAIKRDLTTGPIGPALFQFAIPTLISSIVQSLQGSVNSIWVGRFLGENALAATSSANLVLFLTMSFVFGFGMAATILIGQASGRKDLDQVRRVFGTIVGSFFVIVAIVSALGWIFTPQLLGLLHMPPEAVAPALAYLRVIFLVLPPALTLAIITMTLRGTGDAMTPLWFMLGVVVIDCGLNPLLILGVGPFPRMGIAGSATATLVANLLALVVMVVAIYWRDMPIRLRGAELGYLRPDPALLKRIVAMGFPMGLQMIVLSLAGIAMVRLVNREGVDTAAAYGVALQLWTYVQMPAVAVSAAVSAMAAQNIGAGKWDRIGAITRSGILFNLAMTGGLVVLLAIADRPALALFLGGDSPALPIAQHIQLIVTWSFLLAGGTMVLFGTMRANGVVWVPLCVFAFTMLPLRLGIATFGRGVLGHDALWISFPISSVTSLALAIAFYRWGNWRKPRAPMMQRPSPEAAAEEALAAAEPEGRMTPGG